MSQRRGKERTKRTRKWPQRVRQFIKDVSSIVIEVFRQGRIILSEFSETLKAWARHVAEIGVIFMHWKVLISLIVIASWIYIALNGIPSFRLGHAQFVAYVLAAFFGARPPPA